MILCEKISLERKFQLQEFPLLQEIGLPQV